MTAKYTIGQVLSSGATVDADSYIQNPDGSSFETMTDSEGNGENISTPSPATRTQQEQLAAAVTNLQSVVALLAPGLAQGEIDIATLTASADAQAPIVLRLVEDVMTMAQAIADILAILQVVEPPSA